MHVTHDQGEALGLGQRIAVVHEGKLVQVDTPEAVYERPAHRFVASFVGSPGMNRIGCVAVFEESEVQIRMPGVDTIRLPRSIHFQRQDLPRNVPVMLELGVRAESVKLAGEHREPSLPLPAVVKHVEFQGGSWLVVLLALRASAQTLHSRAPSGRELREGEQIVVHLELDRASWFDPSSGVRVPLDCQPHTDAIA